MGTTRYTYTKLILIIFLTWEKKVYLSGADKLASFVNFHATP